MSFFSLPIVLDVVAKASVILAVTALVAAFLRRASASARHFVWTLGLLSTLAAPVMTMVLPRWELPIVRISAQAPLASTATALPNDSRSPLPVKRSPAERNSIAPPVSATASTAAPAPQVRVLPSWSVLALFAWAAGAALILGRMLLGLVAVRWMSRRCPEMTEAPWLAQARVLAGDLALHTVRFHRGAPGTMPMAWGILQPSVLMPADADTWPAHRLRVVLLHELAHVKRRDCLTHLVAQVACAMHWFNPLAWMAARRLRTERERACDDLVLAAGTRGSDYADQLLDIARVMRAGRFPSVLAGASLAMAQRSQLEGRLMAILDPSVPRRGLTRSRAAASAAIFAVVMLAVASVQPWAEERSPSPLLPASDRSAAVNAPIIDPPEPGAVQVHAPSGKTLDRQRDVVQQDVVQDAIQAVRGQVKGAVQGGIARGITGGVAGGVTGGVVGGIASAVTEAVVDGVMDGIAGAAQEMTRGAQDAARNEREKIVEKGRARDPRTVNALMEALKDTDKDVRETAMHALVQMRDPRMFEPLVAALKDASADVREQAAFGLGQLRDPRAIEPLAGAMKDQSASVREQAVFALGQLRAVAAFDPLAAALHDTSADVREQAAHALGQIRDRRAVEPLISVLKDEKPDVREQAAFALGQLRDPRAVDALVIALKDAAPDVREQAAFALGQIGDARAIDALTVALKDAKASVRQQAAFALGQIR